MRTMRKKFRDTRPWPKTGVIFSIHFSHTHIFVGLKNSFFPPSVFSVSMVVVGCFDLLQTLSRSNRHNGAAAVAAGVIVGWICIRPVTTTVMIVKSFPPSRLITLLSRRKHSHNHVNQCMEVCTYIHVHRTAI